MTSLEKPDHSGKNGVDPILAAIREAGDAKEALRAEEIRNKALESTIPERLREWPGVFLGLSTDRDGSTEIFALSADTITSWFEGAPAADRQCERIAFEELIQVRALQCEAYRAAGLPYLPYPKDGEPGPGQHYRRFIDRVCDAETAVFRTRPTTPGGLLAKLRFVAAYCVEASGCETAEEIAATCGEKEGDYLVTVLADDAAALLTGGQA